MVICRVALSLGAKCASFLRSGFIEKFKQNNLFVCKKAISFVSRVQQLRAGPMNFNTPNDKIMPSDIDQRICWIDMEMTGLDPDRDTIMEISCVVTDKDLNEVARIEQIILHQPEYVLNAMDDWCKQNHGASGLTEACLKSKISLKEAEDTVLVFLQRHTTPKKVPLGGNSVHADRQFIRRYMPKVYEHLHYRIIDVSSIRELCKRWYPDVSENEPKIKKAHRAYEDIRQSIQQLQYFRKTLFK
ncbi:oligoribonuclease, mitochondrial-like [Varroa jacobsoni]|uniref:Probable oligoribonuclease n=1 Tax=Varroa destructor TaxID=109461 RepID=A0A7M7JVU5_VARDE|nr:oligoribonuclease, mitochondrial-like [Varroa destructor]XP_022705092.1 oligoribonuclease, mitochondrial-like [Varroa jacobsoni]